MKIEDFIKEAWRDHAQNSARVASKIPDTFPRIQEDSQISSMAHLITHVFGEHLGDWQGGLTLLEKLSVHEKIKDEGREAVARGMAVLHLIERDGFSIDSFSKSDQVRIFSVAAAARVAHGQIDSATKMLNSALAISAELSKTDPAQRALAVTGNNLACALEDKPDRTACETEAMVMAASLALDKWQVAGGWNEIQSANYRMAKSLLQAGDHTGALECGLNCLKICKENSAGAYPLFLAYECLATGEMARGDLQHFHIQFELAQAQFNLLKGQEKEWCTPDFEKLRKLIPLN